MNALKTNRFRRAPRHSIEPLEARIAPAAVVDLAGVDLSVVDTGGGSNAIDISVVGSNYHFSDPGGIAAGNGATMIDATSSPGLDTRTW